MSFRYRLLALLSQGPKYGPQLHAEIEVTTGEVRPLNAALVDTVLQQLERDGFVVYDGAETDGPRKRLRSTTAGERELAGWLRSPPDLASRPHDELATKILVALQVPGTDVHEVVQVHRRYLVELMQQWTRIKQDNAGHDLRAALAVDAELFRLDAVIRWLDAAEGRLRHAAGHPPWLVRPQPRPGARAGVSTRQASQRGPSSATADRIRTSDADREDVTVRLREHFAEGRLTRAELDERVTAALQAKTIGDLRRVIADLPEPAPALPPPQTAEPRPVLRRRGPLILPLLTLGLLGVLLTARSEWRSAAFVGLVLGFALVMGTASVIAAARYWLQMRRH